MDERKSEISKQACPGGKPGFGMTGAVEAGFSMTAVIMPFRNKFGMA
jgi:hypothetical protein